MSKNPKNWLKSKRIANIDREILHNFWMTWGIPMKFSGNIRLDEDVLKTSWRHLSPSSSKDVFKSSSRRLHQNEYIPLTHTSPEEVFKTSSRRLDQDQYTRLGHTSSRHLQDVFKTSCKIVFKTSSRRLQGVFKTYHQAKLFLSTGFQDVFEIYSKRFWYVLQRRLSIERFA